jgi:hypothetical protein
VPWRRGHEGCRTVGRGMGTASAQRAVATCVADSPMASGGRRARPVGERRVARPGDPQMLCTEAHRHGARTTGRRPASACVYGEVRDGPTWRRRRRARSHVLALQTFRCNTVDHGFSQYF